MKELVVKGRQASPERNFWRVAIQEIRKDSIKRVEDAAKQLIAVVTLLSGLYTRAIVFSQVPKDYCIDLKWLLVDLKVLFVGPLALWALCLLSASLVLYPRRFMVSPYDPDKAEDLVVQALKRKYRWLGIALGLLVLSLLWMVAAAWAYLDVYVAE